MHKFIYLKIIFLFISYLHAEGVVISINENQTQMEILNKTSLFKDTTGKLTLKEVKKQKFKAISRQSLNFGYAYNTTLWIKFRIQNNSSKKVKKVLSFQTAELIRLYDGQNILTQKGYRQTIKPKFELLFEPHELRTFYVEAYSEVKVLRAKLTLYSQWDFLNNEFRYIIAFVIFFTALGIMLIYNLLLLLATKDSLYGYYLLYLFSLFLFQLALFDIFKLYIVSDAFHEFLSKGVLLPLMFLIFSVTLFSIKFLNLWKFPLLHKVLKAHLYIAPLMAVLSYNNWIIEIRTVLLILSPWLFIVVGSGFWAWHKGEGQAKYYVLGWSFFCLVSILTFLRVLGIFSISNELVLVYFYIATFIVETLFFSLSITHKIEILKENEETKLKLLVAEKTAKIEKMLEQKELLYQELNHRVKNNIQMILTLLTLQIGDSQSQETKEELLCTKNRVNSLLGLYDKLYLDSNDAEVDTYIYLENIVQTVQTSFNKVVEINLNVQHELNNSELIYCGLIVNELVTNSFKYAFVNNGYINVSLKKHFEQIHLEVRDNGGGFEKTQKKSLGMEIVKALVYKQLLGTMDINCMGRAMKDFNILIIEDEALVALEMKRSIEEMGFHVLDYATTSLMAKEILDAQSIHLIIMDINLGEERDGIELYESWESHIPIVYLTAYKDENTIGKAINTNPYGYIVKPYHKEELYALIKLVYFKVYEQGTGFSNKLLSEALYCLDAEYSYDLQNNQLFYNEKNIHLTTKEKQLLGLLIEYDGKALSFESIEEVIWGNEPTANNAIRTLVYRLRGKINPNLIEKVFGYGIRLLRT